MTDTPTTQPDLSDEGLSQLVEAIFEMDIVDAVKAVRSIRDQARAAERSSKPVQYRYVNEERIQALEAEQKALKAEIAAERKKTLLWARVKADNRGHYELGNLFQRAAEDGGKDA